MTLEEVIDVICKAHAQTEEPDIVRLHTGDPSIYGAIREQMDRLDELEIAYDDCPGVSSSVVRLQVCSWNIHCQMYHKV